MAAQSDTKKPTNGEQLWQMWKGRIDDALRREKKFRQAGRKCVDIYEAKESDKVPYAILYSNTEILAPSLYSNRPIPFVVRRFKDEDPLGKAVAEVSTRLLKFQLDTESANYDNFDDLTTAAVLEALLVNRGLTRFKYMPATGTSSEGACGEAVRWDKFFHGYARTWKKVPWIGFEWDMTKEEIRKNFKDAKLEFSKYIESDESEEAGADKDEKAGVTLYTVYEIWDKDTRKVYFFSACCPSGPLRVVDDPLGLSNFYPVPKPLNFMRKVSTLIPTPLYEQYRQQAVELNDITRRLRAIIKAIRFRGAYNSTVEGIENMLKAEDNVLVPIENMASMPENTSIDKLLWTVPTNELATTAQSLYVQREQCKTVIYEIMGISDILRGASRASETATAQEIKNQWGSLRLKKMQKEVQRYVREALEIIVEISGSNFSIDTMQQMTGLQFPTAQQKQQAQMQISQANLMAQMQGQQPPPPPPELAEMLQTPSWEEISAILQNDIVRKFKVDIETNSTIDAEAAQDKQDISELMNALSQLFMAFNPLVEKGVMPFEVAKEMILLISRRYNFGPQLEEALNKMGAAPPPQPEQPDPSVALESQLRMKELEREAQLADQEFQHKQALAAIERETAILEARIAQDDARLKANAIRMKMAQQAAAHEQKMAQIAASAKREPANASV